MGELTEAGRVLTQTNYRMATGQSWMDDLIISSFKERVSNLQSLISSYSNSDMLNVYLGSNQTQFLRTDEYILTFISQLSKINNQILFNGGFNNLTINPTVSQYI
jgi:hypothetical protein